VLTGLEGRNEDQPMSDFAVILPAAGRSTRFGDSGVRKIFAELAGRAVWLRAVEPFVSRPDVRQVILAINPEDRPFFEGRYASNVSFWGLTLVDGGAERADSVERALRVVDPECRYIAVHDAARPCVASALVDAVFAAARTHGAAVPGVDVTDTLKRVDAQGRLVETVPRAGLVAVQTPQAFRRDWLEEAYARRDRSRLATDDAQLVEALGHACQRVEGSPFNLKITRREDLTVGAAFLAILEHRLSRVPGHPFAEEAIEQAAGPKPSLKDLFDDP
jgi:2-C-methyl-D-erythritol 4-phosphate cytidylyltransferase